MTDDALRIFIYERVIESGKPPSSIDIGMHFDVAPAVVRDRLAALKIGKTVLVHPESHEIWMAGPFASKPSGHSLTDGTTTWEANCVWDMFGVTMLVGRALRGKAKCPDCGEIMHVECDPAELPSDESRVVHFLVPARHWYADIGFT